MSLPCRSPFHMFAAALLAVLAGCGIPLSTLHGPVPVPVNTSAVTVGLGPVFLDTEVDEDLALFNLFFGPYANFRYGISERLEVGTSTGVFNGFTAAAKYRSVPGPLSVSANLPLPSRFVCIPSGLVMRWR